MAATDYGPEIKAAQAMPSKTKQNKFPPKRSSTKPDTPAEAKAEGDTPAEMARDKARGIVEGSPQDEMLDMQRMHGQPAPHQVAAATSIAHAILGRGTR
jgi:hypothetical protein